MVLTRCSSGRAYGGFAAFVPPLSANVRQHKTTGSTSMQDETKAIREGIGAVADLIKIAGDDPQVREAAKNLGQTAVTITKTINTALLPLAAVNFAFDKARAYFSGRFQRDLLDRTKDIPLDSITDPKASVAGPALQGLAFTHEEPTLKSMYLSLIATSMDRRASQTAHPAFVEIIKQLEGREADLLGKVLQIPGSLPVAQIRATTVGQPGWRVQTNHLMNLSDLNTKEPVVEPGLAAMVDNWNRLGLVVVRYDEFLEGPDSYAWVEARPEYKQVKAAVETDLVKISFERGRAGRTDLGKMFADAVGLVQQEPAPTPPDVA
jgi:hypothetical protein